MNKLYVVLTVLFVLLAFVLPVYASDDEVNMMDLPRYLSEKLGLPTGGDYFAGRILASGIVLMLFLLPTVFACTKFGKDVVIPSLFAGFLAFGFDVALGWLDWWFLLIICMVVALMFSGQMRNFITGSRGGG